MKDIKSIVKELSGNANTQKDMTNKQYLESEGMKH